MLNVKKQTFIVIMTMAAVILTSCGNENLDSEALNTVSSHIKSGDETSQTNNNDFYANVKDYRTLNEEIFGSNELEIIGVPLTRDQFLDCDIPEEYQKSVEDYYNDGTFETLNSFLDGLNDAQLKEQYYLATLLMIFIQGEADFDKITLEDWNINDFAKSKIQFYQNDNPDRYSVFYETGISYESFYNLLLKTFTPRYTEWLLNKYKLFYLYNDEVYVAGYTINPDIRVVLREYEVLSQTDTEAIIRETRYYVEGGYPIYEPEKKDEYGTYHIDNRFILTENGWRADFFTINGLCDAEGNDI